VLLTTPQEEEGDEEISDHIVSPYVPKYCRRNECTDYKCKNHEYGYVEVLFFIILLMLIVFVIVGVVLLTLLEHNVLGSCLYEI
jgi:uncharacterized membrane protein